MDFITLRFSDKNEMLFHDASLDITIALKLFGSVIYEKHNPDVSDSAIAQIYFDATREYVRTNFHSVDEINTNMLHTKEFFEYIQERLSDMGIKIGVHSIDIMMTADSFVFVDGIKRNLPTPPEMLANINRPKSDVPVYEIAGIDEETDELVSKTATGPKKSWWKRIFK